MTARLALAALFCLAAAAPASAGDPAAGEILYRKCMVCHRVGPEARNTVGPQLNGILGRKAGSVEGFSYSVAMRQSGLVWDEATLRRFIHEPRDVVPRTKMTYGGIDDDQQVDDLIAYLGQFKADGSR